MKHLLALLPSLVLGVRALPSERGSEPIVLPVRQISFPRGIINRGIPRQSLIDRSSGYLADVLIGSPPQRTALMVDTGSWVTWVNEHPDCRSSVFPEFCEGLPLYSRSASNPPPKRVPALDQVARYPPSETVHLEGYSDVFTWGGGTKVTDQPFAVVKRANGQGQYVGILALGPDGGKGFDAGSSSSSVVATMAKQGLIKSRAFSLALGATRGRDSNNTGETLVTTKRLQSAHSFAHLFTYAISGRFSDLWGS